MFASCLLTPCWFMLQDQVERVLQKQLSMEDMFEKRRVSLKKLAAKQTRPVQPVAPRPEAIIKSPMSSPGASPSSALVYTTLIYHYSILFTITIWFSVLLESRALKCKSEFYEIFLNVLFATISYTALHIPLHVICKASV